MLEASKTDGMLLNFKFDGTQQQYLKVLPFKKAQAIFRFRSRMFLTKLNFPGRWNSLRCIHCGNIDSDEHIFNCTGYDDLMIEGLDYKWVYTLEGDIQKLYERAEVLQKIYERMEILQEMTTTSNE